MLQGRFLIVERPGRDDTLLIRAMGSGYRAFDASWSAKSAGLPLDEQPDVDYGTWLAKGYLGVLAAKASAGRRGRRHNLPPPVRPPPLHLPPAHAAIRHRRRYDSWS